MKHFPATAISAIFFILKQKRERTITFNVLNTKDSVAAVMVFARIFDSGAERIHSEHYMVYAHHAYNHDLQENSFPFF